MFGAVERVKIVRNRNGISRGYAFIVYERERDMKGAFGHGQWELPANYSTTVAYKEAEHMQVLGKRILVDVERGRTVRGWKPRRLGGGLGGRPKKEPEPFGGVGGGGGGGRGGFRGGMGGGRGFGDRGGFRFVFSDHAACPSHLTLFPLVEEALVAGGTLSIQIHGIHGLNESYRGGGGFRGGFGGGDRGSFPPRGGGR